MARRIYGDDPGEGGLPEGYEGRPASEGSGPGYYGYTDYGDNSGPSSPAGGGGGGSGGGTDDDGTREPPGGHGQLPYNPGAFGPMRGQFGNNFVNMQAYLGANQYTGVGGGMYHQDPPAGDDPHALTFSPAGQYTAGMGNLDKGIWRSSFGLPQAPPGAPASTLDPALGAPATTLDPAPAGAGSIAGEPTIKPPAGPGGHRVEPPTDNNFSDMNTQLNGGQPVTPGGPQAGPGGYGQDGQQPPHPGGAGSGGQTPTGAGSTTGGPTIKPPVGPGGTETPPSGSPAETPVGGSPAPGPQSSPAPTRSGGRVDFTGLPNSGGRQAGGMAGEDDNFDPMRKKFKSYGRESDGGMLQ